MDSQTRDNTRFLGRVPDGSQKLLLQDAYHTPTGHPKASGLAHLWDPLTQLSMRASILKGTTLLPYLHSETKFEQMLEEMLHRDVKKDEKMERDGEEGAEMEERRAIYYGGGLGRKSPDRRDVANSVEGERGVLGVMCRWCSQLFPSVVVLLQHERYLCKMNREVVEAPDHPSSPLHFPSTAFQLEKSKPNEVSNSLPGGQSPLQKAGWQCIPQQLLAAMHSPQPQQAFWSHEKGSPIQRITCSPELSSPGSRRRIPSSELSSPVGLNGTNCLTEFFSPQTGRSWSQSEPLDLSLPKQQSEQVEKSKTGNSNSDRAERRELKRPSPTAHLLLQHHSVYRGAGAPAVFPGSLYNGFSTFNQSALGFSGHDGITALPFSHPANGSGFLSPRTYMVEGDSEAALKKFHQERKTLMVSKAK